MAENDNKAGDTNSEGGANNGSTDSNASNNGGSDDSNQSAKKPSDTPIAANGNSNASNNSGGEQDEGLERSPSEERKLELNTEQEKSFATEFNKARTEALSLGLRDSTALDNYATSVANKNMRGDPVNPIEEVRNVAGSMAAALAQANMTLQLNTSIATSDHAFVGNGVIKFAQSPSITISHTG